MKEMLLELREEATLCEFYCTYVSKLQRNIGMLRTLSAVRITYVCVVVAVGVFALPVRAQRVGELTVGPVRHLSGAQGRDSVSDSSRALGISIVHGSLIVDEARSDDGLAPFSGIPLGAPQRRCEAVFPLVSLFALGALAAGAFVQILPGARPDREILIPVAVGAVVGIGVAAVLCNR